MSSFSFQILDIKDLDAIRHLETLSFPNHWSRGQLEDHLLNKNSINLGLFRQGKLLAKVLGLGVLKEIEVLKISVLPEFRKKGFGAKLFYEYETRARQDSFSLIRLEVRKSNKAALRLYKNFEYKETGIRKAYYSGNHEDALVLSKNL